MDDELPRREVRVPAGVAEHQAGAGVGVEVEPLRELVLEAHRHPLALGGLPDDLGGGHALADRVEDVEQLVFDLVAGEPLADEVGVAHVLGGVRGGLDEHGDLGHAALAGLEHAGIVEVQLLHELGELEVAQGGAVPGRLGLAEHGGQALGGGDARGLRGDDGTHALDRAAALLAQRAHVDGVAAVVDELDHQWASARGTDSIPVPPHTTQSKRGRLAHCSASL